MWSAILAQFLRDFCSQLPRNYLDTTAILPRLLDGKCCMVNVHVLIGHCKKNWSLIDGDKKKMVKPGLAWHVTFLVLARPQKVAVFQNTNAQVRAGTRRNPESEFLRIWMLHRRCSGIFELSTVWADIIWQTWTYPEWYHGDKISKKIWRAKNMCNTFYSRITWSPMRNHQRFSDRKFLNFCQHPFHTGVTQFQTIRRGHETDTVQI